MPGPRRLMGVARLAPAAPAALVTLLAISVLVLVPRSAHANSVYSSGGLGEPSLEENARLRALGGAGAAEHGASEFSLVNPASIAEAQHLVLEATLLAARRSVTTLNYGDETASETTFPSVRLVVRFPGSWILGGSYLLGTNGQFGIVRPESTGAASLVTADGRGGISFVRATLAKRITGALRAGVDFEVIGGSFHEEWSRDFVDPALETARDTIDVTWDRVGRWRFGAQIVRPRWAIGGAYELERRLSITQRSRTAASDIRETGIPLRIPAGFAAGFQLSVGGRGRLVGQYRRQEWDEESLSSDLVSFRPLVRYSAGFERAGNPGSKGLLGRIPIRIGGTFLNWSDLLPPAGALDVTGGSAKIDEWAVSLGSGLRTKDGGGAIDFSLEGGRRGVEEELGAAETFFRAALSLRVSDETWR
jgi:hypothetical protein